MSLLNNQFDHDKIQYSSNISKKESLSKVELDSSLYQEIVNILTDEADIYEKLFKQETKKNIAIKNQDIDVLQKVNSKENFLLNQRDNIEKKRNEVFKQLESKFCNTQIKKLNDLLKLDIPNIFFDQIVKLNQKIRLNIKKLEKIVPTNQNIIIYNAKFFHDLLENLARRSTQQFTYNLKNKNIKNGENVGSSRPLFLDANC